MSNPQPDEGPRFGLRANLYRPEQGANRDRVGYMELFFDLVFVFAVTQESGLISDHPSLPRLIATIVLALAVWWTWICTAWVTNWLDPTRGPVRALLIGLMGASLILSATIGRALGDGGAVFAFVLVGVSILRPVFAVLALARYRPQEAANFVKLGIWALFSSPFWLLGAFDEGRRLIWWCAAIAVDFIAPLVRYAVPVLGRTPLHAWKIRGKHLSERVSLFVLIALGESVVVIGEHVAESSFDFPAIVALAGTFAQTVLLWFLYFNHGEALGSKTISRTDLTGAIARSTFTYFPSLLVLGIVLNAVATELMLEHVAEASTGTWEAGLWTGSTVLYLLGNLLFRRSLGDGLIASHVVATTLLAGVFAAHMLLPAIATIWITAVVVGGVVIFDDIRFRRRGGSEEDDQL